MDMVTELLRDNAHWTLAFCDLMEENQELLAQVEQLQKELDEWQKGGLRIPPWLKKQSPRFAKVLGTLQNDDDLRGDLSEKAGDSVAIGALAYAFEQAAQERGEPEEVRSA